MRRVIRFFKNVCCHPGIPRWLKIGLIILLAIPGPIDELLAAIILIPLAILKREIIVECWKESA